MWLIIFFISQVNHQITRDLRPTKYISTIQPKISIPVKKSEFHIQASSVLEKGKSPALSSASLPRSSDRPPYTGQTFRRYHSKGGPCQSSKGKITSTRYHASRYWNTWAKLCNGLRHHESLITKGICFCNRSWSITKNVTRNDDLEMKTY